MNRRKAAPIITAAMALTMAGCAGQTTDPHQGGLFSYNPGAYEQRIQERSRTLARLQAENSDLEKNEADLAAMKKARQQELAGIRKKLAELSASTAALQKKIRRTEMQTRARQKERDRILAQLREVQASSLDAANSADLEAQRLELERLKKKRARLEKEIEELMQL